MKQLTTIQIQALRGLDPDDDAPGFKPRQGTVDALAKRGLVKQSGDTLVITETGTRFIREYVNRTGNGPEELKAMFRFGGRR